MKDKRLIVAAAVALLLLLLVAAWALWWNKPGGSPAVARAAELRTQMMKQMGDPTLPPEERENVARQFAEQIRSMSTEEREEFFQVGNMQQETIELDGKQLKRFTRKLEGEQGSAPLDVKSLPPGLLGGEMSEDKMIFISSDGPGKQVLVLGLRQDGANGAQSFGRNEQGESQQVERRVKMLDQTTPQMRASMDEMKRKMSNPTPPSE